MQIAANGEKYDARMSKDGRYEYTIMFDGKSWNVDCWITTGEYIGANHWNKWYRAEDEAKAIAEFNRFE